MPNNNSIALPQSTGRWTTFAEFLSSTPAEVTEVVSDMIDPSLGMASIRTPPVELYCPDEKCNGKRIFAYSGSTVWISKGPRCIFLDYVCRNCGTTKKTFALYVSWDGTGAAGRVHKLGEVPPFGPPIPARLISLVGPDRELFLKGRRAELRGLGIGAFAYYRRVVEQQKSRIIGEIRKVASRLGASTVTLKTFEDAEAETHFSAAIEKIKNAIPESLRINGHNPLTLLHSALSEGLHAKTDEQCLELATSIRVVLGELADRVSLALKDEAELKSAVGRLLNREMAAPE